MKEHTSSLRARSLRAAVSVASVDAVATLAIGAACDLCVGTVSHLGYILAGRGGRVWFHGASASTPTVRFSAALR